MGKKNKVVTKPADEGKPSRKVKDDIVRPNPSATEEASVINRRIYRESVQVNNFYKTQLTKMLSDVSHELGLSKDAKFTHYNILCVLYHEGEQTLTQLADAVGVTAPNVSNSVNELCELGLVERTTSKEDRRQIIIRSTELGHRFGDLIVPRIAELGNAFYPDENMARQLLDFYDAAIARIAAYQREHS